MTEKFRVLKKFDGLFKVDLLISGYNGERAVLKIKRNGIPMFSVRKTEKNLILVRIYRKDLRKVFAFFEHSCYNIKRVQPVGGYAFFKKSVKKIPVLLGSLFFLLSAFFTRDLILEIDVIGNGAFYEREVLNILDENGIREFSFITGSDIPLLNAKILSLPDVGFASVKKQGYILKAEVVVYPSVDEKLKEDFVSDCDGVLRELTVISGTPVVKEGDEIKKGDVLVRAYDMSPCVPIARAFIECEVSVCSKSEEDALKRAKFLCDGDIISSNVSFDGENYIADIKYIRSLSANIY